MFEKISDTKIISFDQIQATGKCLSILFGYMGLRSVYSGLKSSTYTFFGEEGLIEKIQNISLETLVSPSKLKKALCGTISPSKRVEHLKDASKSLCLSAINLYLTYLLLFEILPNTASSTALSLKYADLCFHRKVDFF